MLQGRISYKPLAVQIGRHTQALRVTATNGRSGTQVRNSGLLTVELNENVYVSYVQRVSPCARTS